MHLKSLTYTAPQKSNNLFPFNLSFLKKDFRLEFSPITYFVGTNGAGKSTLLEAIALKSQLPTIGESESDMDYTLKSQEALADQVTLSYIIKTRKGFFMRAEDVFGYKKKLDNTIDELSSHIKDLSQSLTGYGRTLAVGSLTGQINTQINKYDGNLDARSHGQAFLKLIEKRVYPNGLYLMDEPETPLSFENQLKLAYQLQQAVNENCQFIIATHSPVLTAIPGCTTYDFTADKPKKIAYKDIEQFSLLRHFLNNPQKYFQKSGD